MLPAGATPERGPNAAATRAAAILPATERDAMITGMVEGLAKRLQSNPQDAGGWIKLIRSRVVMGNREQAKRDVRSTRDAYKLDSAKLNQINANARELGPQNSPVRECR